MRDQMQARVDSCPLTSSGSVDIKLTLRFTTANAWCLHAALYGALLTGELLQGRHPGLVGRIVAIQSTATNEHSRLEAPVCLPPSALTSVKPDPEPEVTQYESLRLQCQGSHVSRLVLSVICSSCVWPYLINDRAVRSRRLPGWSQQAKSWNMKRFLE